MSRRLTKLTIFVSGTSEADSEKSAFRRVVEELNRMLEKTHGITIRVLSWPDDFRPGVNTDPQAELNRQIGSSYDIYLGVLGSRFGTPTQRAGSGTEEEFEAALARFLADTRSVRLLFYFKRSAEDPFSIDVDQLQKVKGFREALTNRGVVYRDFQDTADFVLQTRNHISDLIVDEWRNDSWVAVASAPQNEGGSVEKEREPTHTGDAQEAETHVDAAEATCNGTVPTLAKDTADLDDPEFGFLEYVEGFHGAVAQLTETLGRFAENTTKMNERIRARTAETESLRQEHERVKHIGGSRAQQEYVLKAKDAVDGAAADLNEYADAMTVELERFRSASRAMFENLRLVLVSGEEFESDSTRSTENRHALAQLIEVMETGRQGVANFQTTIRKTPALTGRYKRARKRAASMLGELIAEVSIFIDEAKEVLAQMSLQ